MFDSARIPWYNTFKNKGGIYYGKFRCQKTTNRCEDRICSIKEVKGPDAARQDYWPTAATARQNKETIRKYKDGDIMDEFVQLLTWLSDIVFYVIYGSLFLYIYRFIAFSKFQVEHKYHLVSALASGFVLKLICDAVLLRTNHFIQDGSSLYYGLSLAVMVLAAYILGRLRHSTWVNGLLLNIGVERTLDRYIFDPIITEDAWVYIILKGYNKAVLGQCLYRSENSDKPVMALVKYQYIDPVTGDILVDRSKSAHEMVVVDTRDVELVEVTYEKRELY